MRKTLGQVCYPRAEQVFDDPEKEAARRALMMSWRREQLAQKTLSHVRRIVREDGLARSIEELHDREGRPPPHVSLDRLIRQYKRLKRQQGWLSAIRDTCRETLRALDLARFIRETAEIEQRLLERKAAREQSQIAIAQEEQEEARLPPKLAALIRQEVKRDIRRKEMRNALPERSGAHYLLMSRRVWDMMQYMHLDDLPDHVRATVDDDPETRYRFLMDAYWEMSILVEDLTSNLYELEEYVESADLVAMRYE